MFIINYLLHKHICVIVIHKYIHMYYKPIYIAINFELNCN